jgi:hypothetical protein
MADAVPTQLGQAVNDYIVACAAKPIVDGRRHQRSAKHQCVARTSYEGLAPEPKIPAEHRSNGGQWLLDTVRGEMAYHKSYLTVRKMPWSSLPWQMSRIL